MTTIVSVLQKSLCEPLNEMHVTLKCIVLIYCILVIMHYVLLQFCLIFLSKT